MKAFVLEDSPERIKWFKENFIHIELHIATDINEVEKVFQKNYDILFLDHDLRGEFFVSSIQKNTGFSFCVNLCNSLSHKIDKETPIIIHSLNSVGAKNMYDYLIKHKFYNIAMMPFSQLTKQWERGTLSICGKTKYEE